MRKISWFLVFVFCVSIFIQMPLYAKAGTIDEWDIEFELNESGDGYVVTGCYDFASGDLVIPGTYNSLPVTGIADYACYMNNGIESVTIPDSVEYVGESAFSSCENIGSVDLGKGVKSLGNSSFFGIVNLTNITIPESVESIGANAFSWCEYLMFVSVPDSVTRIGEKAFYNTHYYNESYNWQKGLLYIDNNLIEAMAYTTEAELKSSTHLVADNAFSKCTKLSEIVLPASLEYIGDNAFGDASTLKYTFFEGTKSDFGSITKGKKNKNLISSKIHYEAKGHTYSDKWTIDVEPTCTRVGEKSHHCTQCEIRTDITSMGYGDHIPSSWKTNPTASVFGEGCRYKECTECGEILESKTLPQLKCATPKLSKAVNVSNGVKFTWNKVKGGDTYVVLRKQGNGKWVQLAKGIKTNSYIDKSAKSGVVYKYTVKAQNEAGLSGYNTTGIAIKRLTNPQKVTLTNENGGICIKWNKVTGAAGYNILRKQGNGSWKKIASVKGTAFTDTTAKAGVTYKYAVQAYYVKYVSAYNTTGVELKRLTAPKLISGVSAKNGVTIKWNSVKGAQGYMVYRKTNGGWSKIATVKNNSTVKFIDKTSKKGVTYKYTVKAYSGKSVSAYNTKGLTVRDLY